MKSYIEVIILLSEDGGKKYVDLNQGVNIITGESKTGKSALVEIIDYCLCSSTSTIPKGKITDFTDIYSLIISINSERYLIARKASFSERKEMFYSKISDDITHENINIHFFNDKRFYNYKIIQKQIEKTLGLDVSNINEDDEEIKEKASLRHMTSYMFQQQNLMASKFALFYRFDDYQKKKDVIQQFPIFAGMVGQEYYSTLMLLTKYKKELKRISNNQVSNERIKEDIKNNLLTKIKDYYALVGQEIDNNLSLEKLIQIASCLPSISDEAYSSDKLVLRYNELKSELEELKERETFLENRILKLDETDKSKQEYIESLEVLQQKSYLSLDSQHKNICPLCNNEYNNINEILNKVEEAASWITGEISLIHSSTSNFAEQKRILIQQKDEINKKIKELLYHIRKIEKDYLSNISQFGLENKLNYVKIQIQVYLETINKGLFNPYDAELIEIQNKINQCNAILEDFKLDKLMVMAKESIDKNMNKLKTELDFEEEFKNYRLSFDLNEFELSLVGKYRHEKVTLSEMGSGANWVSCHIALFLSLLRYFASQGMESPMPLIMFFDQPSQVYFPQDINSDEKRSKQEIQQDKQAVSKMYKVMFDEIEKIHKETGVNPQLIIVDHVDSTTMQEESDKIRFKECTRRVWRNKEALI